MRNGGWYHQTETGVAGPTLVDGGLYENRVWLTGSNKKFVGQRMQED